MFTDIAPDRWSYNIIMRLQKAGVLKGYPDGTFRPEANITREEYAAGIDYMLYLIGMFTAVLPEVRKAVVTTYGAHVLGTGFYISKDGYLLTNAHTVDGPSITLINDGEEVNRVANLVAINNDMDLALLKVDNYKPPHYLKFAAEDAKHGQRIGVIGSAQGLPDSFTDGVVSSELRFGRMQTNAEINPGNSGGPVLDGRGDVVGVVVAKMSDAEGIGLFIPLHTVREFMKNAGVSV